MDEILLVRRLLRWMTSALRARTPIASALFAWAKENGRRYELPAFRNWREFLAALEDEPCAGEIGADMRIADQVAEHLGFAGLDRELFLLAAARERLPGVAGVLDVGSKHGLAPAVVLARHAGVTGADTVRHWTTSSAHKLGLVFVRRDRGQADDVELHWHLDRLFEGDKAGRDHILAALIGVPQATRLSVADFPHVTETSLLVRLLAGARRDGEKGINILIHGPPGTGKTEFARVIGAAAGLDLFATGEADDDREEPTRYDRIYAYLRAQRLLAEQRSTALLFDEMEDLIGDARPSQGDWQSGRSGSKVFVNRMLEENPVPTIWVTNAIGNIDPAILRRMSYILKMDYAPPSVASAMADRIAKEESTTVDPALRGLVETRAEASTIIRIAARAARLAGEAGDGAQVAKSLVRAITDKDHDDRATHDIDPLLYEADRDVSALIDQIVESQIPEVSLLLAGPPGTGKTILAHHLAKRLDRPLVVRRASDLLSMWVGGTEKAIAKMFADARVSRSVLLLDEADSLLTDRSSARANWEVTQVNELLTWLDHHPLPVVAATNRSDMLDPAALRRFLFKLELRPLGRDKARLAFERFFGLAPPTGLDRLRDLTPSDFGNVARRARLLGITDANAFVDELAIEASSRPGAAMAMGF